MGTGVVFERIEPVVWLALGKVGGFIVEGKSRMPSSSSLSSPASFCCASPLANLLSISNDSPYAANLSVSDIPESPESGVSVKSKICFWAFCTRDCACAWLLTPLRDDEIEEGAPPVPTSRSEAEADVEEATALDNDDRGPVSGRGPGLICICCEFEFELEPPGTEGVDKVLLTPVVAVSVVSDDESR